MDFLQNSEKMEAVAFLTDITSHLNNLNLKLQGKNNTVCELMSSVRAFQRKLEVFKSDLQVGCLTFSTTNIIWILLTFLKLHALF